MAKREKEIAFKNEELSAMPPTFELLTFLRAGLTKVRTPDCVVRQLPYVLMCLHSATTENGEALRFATFPNITLKRGKELAGGDYIYRAATRTKEAVNDLYVMNAINRLFADYTKTAVPKSPVPPPSLVDNLDILGRDSSGHLLDWPLSPAHSNNKNETIFGVLHVGRYFNTLPHSVVIDDGRQLFAKTSFKTHKIVVQWAELGSLLSRIKPCPQDPLSTMVIEHPDKLKYLANRPTTIHPVYVRALELYARKKCNNFFNPSEPNPEKAWHRPQNPIVDLIIPQFRGRKPATPVGGAQQKTLVLA